MNRILITGGAGFIGYALLKKLSIINDVNVIILDLEEKITQVNSCYTANLVSGDIRNPEVFNVLDRYLPIETVFHFAAQTSGRISHEIPELDIDTNAKGTLLLTKWCRERGVKRFIYTSSMAVYGNPEWEQVTEETITKPVSNYGISKLAGEYYIQLYGKDSFDYTIFRLFNVYGPGQNLLNLKQGMASIFLYYVLKSEEIPVTGSLQRFRDFIYVDDVLNAMLQSLNNKNTSNQIYNLGTEKRTTVRELINMIVDCFGYDYRIYPIKEFEGHEGDQHGFISNTNKLRTHINWVPKTILEEGMRKMVMWAKEQNI